MFSSGWREDLLLLLMNFADVSNSQSSAREGTTHAPA
jgi:hypothetical protein